MFCSIKNCGSASPNRNIYTFPSDFTVKQQWLINCGLTDSDLTSTHGICEIHFKANDFILNSNNDKSLQQFAIPTLFLDGNLRASSNERTNQSLFQLKESEVKVENKLFDEVGELIDQILHRQHIIQQLSKKLSKMEKKKLDVCLDVTEQRNVFEQLQKLGQFSSFKLKKINSLIKLDKTEVFVKLPFCKSSVMNHSTNTKNGENMYRRTILSENVKNLDSKISSLFQDLESLKPCENMMDSIKKIASERQPCNTTSFL